MSFTKKRVTRNSPKVPADFDSESEDQNGLHIYQNSASMRIPPNPSSFCKSAKSTDHCCLWDLETPSGTDSGNCSSVGTIPWSSEQHPSKARSTLVVSPVPEQTTSFVPSSFSNRVPHCLISPRVFHLISFVTSCLITLALYYYVYITMAKFSTSLSSLSEDIQSSKLPDQVKSSIQQEIEALKDSARSLQNLQDKFSQNLSDVEISLNSLKDQQKKGSIKTENSMQSLQSRIVNAENTIAIHRNMIVNFENLLQQCNTSMFELDEKLSFLTLQMDLFNLSLNSFSQPDGCNSEYIDLAFARHYQDQIGMYDFALGSAGGRIAVDLTSETYSGLEAIQAFGYTLFSLSNSPDVVLEPTVLPGNCWPFPGNDGTLGIKTTYEILLQNVTIDHVPNELTDDGSRSSAPKEFLIRGFKSRDSKGVELGNYIFEKTSPFPFQTFTIKDSSNKDKFSLFQLKFRSNHGHPNLTCIYRVRLHGSISLN